MEPQTSAWTEEVLIALAQLKDLGGKRVTLGWSEKRQILFAAIEAIDALAWTERLKIGLTV